MLIALPKLHACLGAGITSSGRHGLSIHAGKIHFNASHDRSQFSEPHIVPSIKTTDFDILPTNSQK